MEQELRRLAGGFLAAFAVLTVGIGWVQGLRARDLAGHAGNPRVVEQFERQDRGAILAADGTMLARTERDDAGKRRRTYSMPSLVHTTGFLSVRYGRTGLEDVRDSALRGALDDGPLATIWRDVGRAGLAGDDLVLTIDPAVQAAAAEALGNRPGAVLAIDPRTGAIRAMVSAPWFDPNKIDEAGEALLIDQGRPLLNRAIQGQYPPGSTFKTVTAVAALDTGVYQAGQRFSCPPGKGYVVNGFVIACNNVPPAVGSRDYDFGHAFAYSVNANFGEIAVTTGAANLSRYARLFGFESAPEFELAVTPSRLTAAGGSFDDVLLANSGFGQGELSVTPLQMALVAAAVANGGNLPTPYLVEETRAPDGRVLARHTPRPSKRIMLPETAATLASFMTTAVAEGFGGQAAVPGVATGGKTGTAETGGNRQPHSWFIGFAPGPDPQIAVAVIVENGGPGGTVAAPIAGQVMKAALRK